MLLPQSLLLALFDFLGLYENAACFSMCIDPINLVGLVYLVYLVF